MSLRPLSHCPVMVSSRAKNNIGKALGYSSELDLAFKSKRDVGRCDQYFVLQ